MDNYKKYIEETNWISLEFDQTDLRKIIKVPEGFDNEILKSKQFIKKGSTFELINFFQSEVFTQNIDKMKFGYAPTQIINNHIDPEFFDFYYDYLDEAMKDIEFNIQLEDYGVYVKNQIDKIDNYIANVRLVEYKSTEYRILNNLTVIEIVYKNPEEKSENIKKILDQQDWFDKGYFEDIASLCEIILSHYSQLRDKFLQSIGNKTINIEKARFNLTVYELIVLFRLLKEEGIITNNVTSICKFLADATIPKSNREEGLSQNSLQKKWYELEPEAISNVRAKLSNIIQNINKNHLN